MKYLEPYKALMFTQKKYKQFEKLWCKYTNLSILFSFSFNIGLTLIFLLQTENVWTKKICLYNQRMISRLDKSLSMGKPFQTPIGVLRGKYRTHILNPSLALAVVLCPWNESNLNLLLDSWIRTLCLFWLLEFMAKG